MKRHLALVLILSCPAFAQKKNPVTTVVKEILPRQAKNIQAAVETMPAEKFSFKPTEPQMTFGHLVSHMIDSNYYLCAKAADIAQPKLEPIKETDKTALVASLKASFDFCTNGLAKVDDTKLGDTIQAYGGREVPRAWALIALTNDWADHYSAAATYLRLNGLLPPTAQPKKEKEETRRRPAGCPENVSPSQTNLQNFTTVADRQSKLGGPASQRESARCQRRPRQTVRWGNTGVSISQFPNFPITQSFQSSDDPITQSPIPSLNLHQPTSPCRGRSRLLRRAPGIKNRYLMHA